MLEKVNRDVQFTNTELLRCLPAPPRRQTLVQKSGCRGAQEKSLGFGGARGQRGAGGATCTEGKRNMAGLLRPCRRPRGTRRRPHGRTDLPGWPLRHPAGCRAGRHAAKPED